MDVDSGPVLYGLGTAATAFGIDAARINGRFDHASTLSYEMIAASWPLPNGTLLFPRIFSNGDHAPYLGEMAILLRSFGYNTPPLAAIVVDVSHCVRGEV